MKLHEVVSQIGDFICSNLEDVYPLWVGANTAERSDYAALVHGFGGKLSIKQAAERFAANNKL